MEIREAAPAFHIELERRIRDTCRLERSLDLQDARARGIAQELERQMDAVGRDPLDASRRRGALELALHAADGDTYHLIQLDGDERAENLIRHLATSHQPAA
jgi:hypothetical protein